MIRPWSDGRDGEHFTVKLRRAFDAAMMDAFNPPDVLARMIVLTAHQHDLSIGVMLHAVAARVRWFEEKLKEEGAVHDQ